MDDAVDMVCVITSRCMAPAMSAAKRIAWTLFRNTRKNVQVSMPRTLSYSGQLLDSSLTDRLDMVSVKDAKDIILQWSVIRFLLDRQTRHGVSQGCQGHYHTVVSY